MGRSCEDCSFSFLLLFFFVGSFCFACAGIGVWVEERGVSLIQYIYFRYHAEPSGTFYRYDAKAIGSGSEGAQAELQNEFHTVNSSPPSSLSHDNPKSGHSTRDIYLTGRSTWFHAMQTCSP